MFTALNMLGYKSYHMLVASQHRNPRHLPSWHEALQYKVNGIGTPYGPADFDKILQEYSAVTDMPCVNFSDELVAAFPNAKIVLTQRDPKAWIKSVDSVIYEVLSWRIWAFLAFVDPTGMGIFYETLLLAIADWTSPHPWTDRQALAAYMPVHVAHIRSIVPPENLLEFHPRDGWEPLCKFLGKEIPPNEPFPFINKGNHSKNIIKAAIAINLAKWTAPYLVGFGVLLLAWKWSASG